MEYYEWNILFEPLLNHFEEDSAVDGYLFMPYGKQWEHVKSFDSQYIWTLIISDLDDGSTSWEIVSGVHNVNREGYLITKKKCNEDLMIVY